MPDRPRASGRERTAFQSGPDPRSVAPRDASPYAPRAVLDACVLVPAPLRDILMRAGQAGLIVPLWSDRIVKEWILAAARHGRDATAEAAALARTFPDGRVTPPDGLAQQLHLPDPADCHVLAAAIAGGAQTIVSYNIRDFPRHALTRFGIVCRNPDSLLWELHSHSPEIMAGILEAAREGCADTLNGAPTLRRLLRRLRLPRLARAATGAAEGNDPMIRRET